jgi:hypothetical protein
LTELNLEVEISPQLLALSIHLADVSPALRDFQQYRSQAFQDQMSAEIAPDGSAIAPLSERYRQWKERNHPGQPIRKLTGQTVESYRSRVSGNQLIEELRSPHVLYIQQGTSNAPARPYFPDSLTQKDQNALAAIVLKWLLS